MTIAADLITRAQRMGAKFEITGEKVDVIRPQEPLPSALLAELRRHKDEIRAELTKRQYKFVFPHPAQHVYEMTKPLVMICPKLPAYPDPLNDELPEEVEPPSQVSTSESNFPHVERLLDWASNLSEQRRVLDEPVKFREAPLRPVQGEHVSDYAVRQLRTIISARIHTDAGGHGIFKPEWWQDRKDDALAALAALRDALEGSQT